VIRAALAALVVAAVATGCAVGAQAPVLPPGRAVLATPTLDPTVHLFGDTVTAQLDVVVDERRLDPDRIKLAPRFGPYEIVGDVQKERADHGDVSELRYTMQLRCLGPNCIPRRLASDAGPDEPGRGERRAFRFGASRLLYDEGPRDRLLRVVRFPTLESVSRINESQFQFGRFPFVAGYRPLPEVTWFAAPTLLAALLVLAALALLAPAAVLLRRWWRQRHPEVIEEEPELPPLERALLLVLWSRDRPDGEDRRRALEVLAETLDEEGPTELADDARILAWSPSSPSPSAATQLVELVRERTNGHPG
jgi:hypothetical protein